jgi:hypothetical protein
MYLSLTLIFAALSFYVAATPISNRGVPIPLTKHTQIRDANGVVDVAKLQGHVSSRIAYVLPIFFKPFTTVSIPRIIAVCSENFIEASMSTNGTLAFVIALLPK